MENNRYKMRLIVEVLPGQIYVDPHVDPLESVRIREEILERVVENNCGVKMFGLWDSDRCCFVSLGGVKFSREQGWYSWLYVTKEVRKEMGMRLFYRIRKGLRLLCQFNQIHSLRAWVRTQASTQAQLKVRKNILREYRLLRLLGFEREPYVMMIDGKGYDEISYYRYQPADKKSAGTGDQLAEQGANGMLGLHEIGRKESTMPV